jgi:hypothetical protein
LIISRIPAKKENSMELCSDGHDEICFDGRQCPCCEIIKEKDGEIEVLESDNDDLKQQVRDAQN